MKQLIVQCQPTIDACCALCGGLTFAASGVHLALADGSGPVCRTCARKANPSLAALIGLADAAERVGRLGRHMVVPPMSALLELAHAAETYAGTAPKPCRRAG
jgi:hypothetical protein